MPEFRVFKTEWFDKKFSKLDKSLQERIEKFVPQLRKQGNIVGKPLAGVHYFREKKFNGYRVYYLVYTQWSVVLVVDVSDKKVQQASIHQTMLNLAYYQQYVHETLRKKGLI